MIRSWHAGLTAALAVATAAAIGSGPAKAGATSVSKPTVILVHGGFADATISWQGVADRL